jgi:hypothetical protein
MTVGCPQCFIEASRREPWQQRPWIQDDVNQELLPIFAQAAIAHQLDDMMCQIGKVSFHAAHMAKIPAAADGTNHNHHDGTATATANLRPNIHPSIDPLRCPPFARPPPVHSYHNAPVSYPPTLPYPGSAVTAPIFTPSTPNPALTALPPSPHPVACPPSPNCQPGAELSVASALPDSPRLGAPRSSQQQQQRAQPSALHPPSVPAVISSARAARQPRLPQSPSHCRLECGAYRRTKAAVPQRPS